MAAIPPGFRALALALAAVVCVLAPARPARAQGFYYKEITKDDRIYVFNIAANAERFEKTGEMGIGITKPGVGPNGETVVGDNERALQLFFFKHGISEPVPEPVAAGADDRLARRQDAHHDRQRLPGDLEPRPGALHRENSRRQHAARRARRPRGDQRPSFRIRRAKFKLEGWMIKPWLTYETQVNCPAVTGANVGALLEDAAFDVDFSQGQGHVPRARRPVQAAVRRAGNDLVGQPDVRRPRARQQQLLPRPRNRRRALGRDAEQQVRMARRRCSTATA